MTRHSKARSHSDEGAEESDPVSSEADAEESDAAAPAALAPPALAPAALDAPALPSRVRLLRPHGFIDEHGQNRHWHQGEIVGDPAQVGLLIKRGAHVEHLDG